MKRLHVVVEGHGDVEALPVLVVRILVHLGRTNWIVNKRGARIPRGRVVDSTAATKGRPLTGGLDLAVGLAKAARADGLIVVVDADDDCPAKFGPVATEYIEKRMRGAAIMAVREFETWLAMVVDTQCRNLEKRRDAKGLLRTMVRGYKPTVHQSALARRIDVAALLAREPRSFVKLVSDIDSLTR